YNLDRVTTALTGFEKNDRVPTPVTTALTSFQKEEVFSTALTESLQPLPSLYSLDHRRPPPLD
ncbi:hypothetical protein, partial [Thiolapillus sp.]